MKKLLLIRHAKSSWDSPGASDFDRPLDDRGLRDAPVMARALAGRDVRPDLIFASAAKRTRETARILTEGLNAEEFSTSESLYLASGKQILREVAGLDEKTETAMIIGHNPGMHDAVETLCGVGTVDSFPTLAVACIELPVEFWGEISPRVGIMTELLTPATLEEVASS